MALRPSGCLILKSPYPIIPQHAAMPWLHLHFLQDLIPQPFLTGNLEGEGGAPLPP